MMNRTKKTFGVTLLTILLIGMGTSTTAQTTSSTESYSGDFLTRSTLTGDWGGLRNDLAARGVTFDLSLTQVGEGIVSGGRDQDWRYGGRGNITTTIDTQKLGLWPGGFLTVEVEGNYDKSVNFQTGALSAVNSNQLYPMPVGSNFDVPQVSFAQFLSPYFGVVAGKLDTTSGDANEFAHGKGDDQFLNLAFNFNPAVVLITPYSTLGAGLIILPTKDPNDAMFNFNLLQTNGQASTSGFSDLESDQLTFAGQGRVRTDFFGLTGHQLVGVEYSNKTFTSIDQSLRLIVENRGLESTQGAWCVYYNFDQYLYETRKGSGQGVGIFGRFGATEGNPNLIHYFYSFGVGGKGIIPSRPLDRFGIGYYFIDVSNPKFTGLLETTSFLRNEQGFEAFYNFAITPWLQLTPDLQVVRPSQKEAITIGRDSFGLPVVNRNSINTAVVLSFRLGLVF